MNKKTAVLLRKSADKYGVNKREVYKAWYKLSDKERAKERRLLESILSKKNEEAKPVRTDM